MMLLGNQDGKWVVITKLSAYVDMALSKYVISLRQYVALSVLTCNSYSEYARKLVV